MQLTRIVKKTLHFVPPTGGVGAGARVIRRNCCLVESFECSWRWEIGFFGLAGDSNGAETSDSVLFLGGVGYCCARIESSRVGLVMGYSSD